MLALLRIVPEPSSDSKAWWDPLELAAVQQKIEAERKQRNMKVSNPFDPNYLNVPSKSATHAPTLSASKISSAPSIKRKPPPPDPSNKPSAASPSIIKPAVNPSTKPQLRSTSYTGKGSTPVGSLMDHQDEEMKRPGMKTREATNEWQIITPTPMKR